MVRCTSSQFVAEENNYLKEFAGLSTDTKPKDYVMTGSVFIEVDTADVYLFDEVQDDWVKVGD